MKVEQQKDSKQKKIVQIDRRNCRRSRIRKINHLTDTHGASVKAGTGDIRENNRGWGSIKRSRQTF